jgi:nitrate reductase NapA
LQPNRREFLKTAVAAAAAAAVGVPVAKGEALGLLDVGWRWDKGVCQFCGVGCGIRIATRERRSA